MDKESKNNNKAKILIIAGVFVGVLLVIAIGIAYSYFYLKDNSTTNTLAPITTSIECFDVSITGGETNVTTEVNYPIKDSDAISTSDPKINPVEIQVTNNCTNSLEYSLILSSLDNGNSIDDSKIRTQIQGKLADALDYSVIPNVYNNKEIDYISRFPKLETGPNYRYIEDELERNNILGNSEVNNSYILTSKTLASNVTDSYKINLWVDYYEGDSDVYDSGTEHDKSFDNSTILKNFTGAISIAIDITKENVTSGNTVTINGGASTTSSDEVTVGLHVNNADYTKYCLTNYDSTVGCVWNEVTGSDMTINNYELSYGLGTKNVYAYFKKDNGTVTTNIYDSIIYDTGLVINSGTVDNTSARQVISKISTTKVNLLPDNYQEVEYIESTGSQWINTGYKLTSNKVKYEMIFSQTSLLSSQTLFGSEGTDSGGRAFTGVLYSSSASLWVGNSTSISTSPIALNSTGQINNLILETDGNNNFSLDYNGVLKNGTYKGSLYKDGNIAILNNSGSPSQFTKAKLYGFKITDNDNLVRDLIPCYDKNDNNKPGMYDLVTGSFYPNSGSGNFTVGPIKNTQVSSSTETELIQYETRYNNLLSINYSNGYPITEYCVSTSDSECNSSWVDTFKPAGTNRTINVPYNQTGTFYVYLKDSQGTIRHNTIGISAVFDNINPVIKSVSINDNTTSVNINFNATDTQNNVVSYCVNTVNDIVGCTWVPVTTPSQNVTQNTIDFTTTGRHFLFVQDALGNISNGKSIWVALRENN